MEAIMVGISRLSTLILFPVMIYQAFMIESRDYGNSIYIEFVVLMISMAILIRAEYCRQERKRKEVR